MIHFANSPLPSGVRASVANPSRWAGSRRPLGLPLPLYLFGGLAAIAGALTHSPALTCACIVAFFLLIVLLWRPGEPPALLFAAALQWCQVAMKVFHADYYSQSVASMSPAQHGEEAVWLGLIGVVVLALGMKLGARNRKRGLPAFIDAQLRDVSIQRVFVMYLPAAAFAWFVSSAWSNFESVAQILIMTARVKWIFYYLLAYLVLRRQRQRGYLVVATAIEFLSGIGYFSDFRMVFFVLIIVFLALNRRLTLKLAALATAGAVALVIVAFAWTGIKDEYRTYLNGGTGQQVSVVSPVERITTFGSMMGDMNPEELSSQGDAMVRRIEYTDLFAAAIDYVPAVRPFEHGTLLMRAITHILMPRFLFPNKPVLASDSDLTSDYTGIELSGAEHGTSISLGYMAENYVDFGPEGMFFVIFALGCVWGLMYAYLVNHAPSLGVGYAFGTALLIYMGDFAMAQVKLIGGMVAGFLVFAVILRFAAPQVLRLLSTPSHLDFGDSLSNVVGRELSPDPLNAKQN